MDIQTHPIPKIIVFEPTNCCNYHCTKCLERRNLNCNMGYLRLDNFKLMLEKIPRGIEFIGLNGFGEPLLHPDFPNLVRLVNELHPSSNVGFHTNGSLLEKSLIKELISLKVRDIEISVDTSNSETYKKLHPGKYSLDNVLDNVRNLVSARNKNNQNLSIGLAYVIQRENIGQLEDFVLLAKNLGVDFVGPVVAVNPLWGYNPGDMDKFRQQVKEEIDLGIGASKKAGIRFSYSPINRKKIGSANISPIEGVSCSFPFELYPIITWDGFAMPCVWIQDRKYNLGNLLKDSFQEIYSGKKITELRKLLLRGEYLPCCANCGEANL